MKKAKIRIFKTYSAIIAALIALLGFTSSCEKLMPKAMYGTPTARYIVNGKVSSSSSGQEIENIKIKLRRDSTKTDQQGNYQIQTSEFPDGDIFKIEFIDADSIENGEYQNLDTIVEFKDPHFTGGDGDWDAGETSKEFNVQLNPKK